MECFFYFCLMNQIGNLLLSENVDFKNGLLEYAREFELSVILDSNSVQSANRSRFDKYDLVAGFARNKKETEVIENFNALHKINSNNTNWYLGYLSYDLKNEIEDLKSDNPDGLKWPSLLFFIPEILFLVKGNSIQIYSSKAEFSFEVVSARLDTINSFEQQSSLPKMYPRISKEEYLRRVEELKKHIYRGDIYEVNYCMEFYNTTLIDPYQTFHRLTKHTPAPLAAFVKYKGNYLMSVSPERFIHKENEVISSQPIKGTSPRYNSAIEDEKSKKQLESSLKERTENIMITDLVRNDLSKIARKNSVCVDELCGIYQYPHVYQMISTISAKVDNPSFLDIIRATFPMGSMTGAPKIRAMQLIEEFEGMKRGVYSGAVGYIAPGMDFDFCVVIRSLQYNAASQYLSYIVGSALTALADPEEEYKECLLKAYAINPQPKQPEHA